MTSAAVDETASGEACPACGSRRVYPGSARRLVRCLGCRLMRPAVRPSHVTLDRPSGDVRAALFAYDRVAGGRLVQPPAHSRALDVGCGAGSFLDVLQEHGFITEGLEPGPAGSIAERSHRVYAASPLSDAAQGLDARAYRVVSFLDVLQRLPDPVRALRWASERLAESGLVLVDVPNAQATGFESPGEGAYVVFDRASLAGVAARAGLKLTASWTGPDLARSLEDAAARLGPLASPASLAARRLAPLAHAVDPFLARLPKASRHGPRLVAVLEKS